MTPFTDQLSAVRKTQLEAQLDAFQNLTSRALDSANQLFALNIKASRQSVEQAAGTVLHLLDAREPRDLFALGSAAQGQWQNLFAYSRELFSIATGAPGLGWQAHPHALNAPLALLPASTATVPVSPGNAAEQASIAVAGATTVTSEIAAAAFDTGAALAEAAMSPVAAPARELAPEPEAAAPAPVAQAVADAEAAADAAIADDTPPATPKPIVQALKEVAPPPAAAEHPLASTLPLEAANEVVLPEVAPVEHTSPVQAPTGKPPRASRKK